MRTACTQRQPIVTREQRWAGTLPEVEPHERVHLDGADVSSLRSAFEGAKPLVEGGNDSVDAAHWVE